jgi:hypothetical protein
MIIFVNTIILFGLVVMMIFVVIFFSYTQGAKAQLSVKYLVPDTACNLSINQGIGHIERFKSILNCVNVTGTVVTRPHYAPDGDLVFAIKPNEQNITSILNQGNQKKGGLWVEGICQMKPHTSAPWHQGDCNLGGPFPKFTIPVEGQKVEISGKLVQDNGIGEYGQIEIHPIYSLKLR